MFGAKMGAWYVICKSDPRWNMQGDAEGLCCGGGPQEMRDWIDKCKKNFGEPPDDAKQGFMKY
jgi:hypothetical protein